MNQIIIPDAALTAAKNLAHTTRPYQGDDAGPAAWQCSCGHIYQADQSQEMADHHLTKMLEAAAPHIIAAAAPLIIEAAKPHLLGDTNGTN